MAQTPKGRIEYGIRVTGQDHRGKPTIFLHRFFPDQITAVEPLETGSRLTVKLRDNDDSFTQDVRENAEEVKTLMQRCRELDDQASAGPNPAHYAAVTPEKNPSALDTSDRRSRR